MSFKLLTMREVAEQTGLSLSTIQRWAGQGRFPVVKLGRKANRVLEEDLVRFLREHRKPAQDGADDAAA